MIILLMLVGTVSAELPTNVGTNVARVVGYDYYCESYSPVGSIQMGRFIEAFGGVQAVSSDVEYTTEAATIHQVFLEEGSYVGCATLKLLLKEVGIFNTFFR